MRSKVLIGATTNSVAADVTPLRVHERVLIMELEGEVEPSNQDRLVVVEDVCRSR